MKLLKNLVAVSATIAALLGITALVLVMLGLPPIHPENPVYGANVHAGEPLLGGHTSRS